jgi:hypothetical protein
MFTHQSAWLLQKHRTSAFHSVPEYNPQHPLEHRRLRSFFFHLLVKEPGNPRFPILPAATRNPAFQPCFTVSAVWNTGVALTCVPDGTSYGFRPVRVKRLLQKNASLPALWKTYPRGKVSPAASNQCIRAPGAASKCRQGSPAYCVRWPTMTAAC